MAPTNPTEKKNLKEDLNPKQVNAMATFGVANLFFSLFGWPCWWSIPPTKQIEHE